MPRARYRYLAASMFLTAALTACNGTVTPMVPAPAAPSLDRTFTLSGDVHDTAIVRLGGANVQATFATGQVAVATTTDDNGRFNMSITAPLFTLLRVTVTKAGYVSASQEFSVPASGNMSRFWTLQSVAPPLSLGGRYVITIGAAPSCPAFPSGLGERRYEGTLQERGPISGQLALEGQFIGEANAYTLTSGEFARLSFYRPVGIDEDVVAERVGDGGYFAFYGVAVAGVSPGQATIDASFTGLIEYCSRADESQFFLRCAVPSTRCQSTTHRVRLVRQ